MLWSPASWVYCVLYCGLQTALKVFLDINTVFLCSLNLTKCLLVDFHSYWIFVFQMSAKQSRLRVAWTCIK